MVAEWEAVTQTILHDPELAEQGVYGNCLQAAVASVLRLPLDAVPHFAAFHWWPQALTMWAYGRGLKVCGERTTSIPDRLCIVGGISPRGVDHVVVAHGGRVVWDPHPSHDGLVSIKDATWFEDNGDEPMPLPFGNVHAAEVLRYQGYTVLSRSDVSCIEEAADSAPIGPERSPE
jgi:hypothetical protein